MGLAGVIDQVFVFRGNPSAQHESEANRRNQRQSSEWTRDRRVSIQQRPLKYPQDWPDTKAREKGIDVMLAVSFVRAAILHLADVLILASRDTDLEPAIELANQVPNAPKIEVCNWVGSGRLGSGDTRQATACILLDEKDYLFSRDQRVY
jgi:hypothetical protein